VKIPAVYKEPYIKINTVFGVVIIMIFIYSAIYSMEKQNHPIPSFYSEITGEKSVSSGLSGSFSEIVRGNFNKARELNKYGIRVFSFFIIQLFLRVIFSFIYYYQKPLHKYVIFSDCALSVLLAVFCFWPFLVYMASQI
jgi:hypothetical protein